MRKRATTWAALLGVALMAGCSTQESPAARLSAAAQLGEKLFKDERLSASGLQSCRSCHDPAHGHASPGSLPFAFGGPRMDRPGFRDTPSLRYLATTPPFQFDKDGTPTGGFMLDGRADSLAKQAVLPLLGPDEMANGDAATFARRLRDAGYAPELIRVFGMRGASDPAAVLRNAALALEAYQFEDADFHRFDSRYDAWLADTGTLSDAELRGLALFEDPAKGNCAACHPSAASDDGSPPLFTDFTYDALGVPRNAAIPANADAAFFDLGLCGPQRGDLGNRGDLCGAFKVPTLRNIANTAPYFHNGRFATLEEALRFYVRRDTNPEEFYPAAADGGYDRFDDLPPALRGNVNASEAPYDRHPGDAPALDDAELADLAAFLRTLSDADLP